MACVALTGCAASEPDQQQAQPPIVIKSIWDDASGRKAPLDSLWLELRKALSRRTDITVAEKEPPQEDNRFSHQGPPGGGGGGGPGGGGPGGGGGGGPGGGGGGGGPGFGAGGPGGGPGGGGPGGGEGQGPEKPPTPALRLLLAATMEQWNVSGDSSSTVENPKFHHDADSGRSSARLVLRLVSRATGRVVWKKTEECIPPAPVADNPASNSLAIGFDACREEFIHRTAEDIAQGAIDLAYRAANPAPPRDRPR